MDNQALPQTSVIKKQQTLWLVGLFILLSGISLSLYLLMHHSQAKAKSMQVQPRVMFDKPISSHVSDSAWIEHIQEKSEEQNKTIESLNTAVANVIDESKDTSATLEEQAAVLRDLTQKVEALSNQLSLQQKSVTVKKSHAMNEQNQLKINNFIHSEVSEKLEPQEPARDEYVPAGSFAKAVMLGGVDASASVMSQSNPRPTLFRIVDEGTLPNHHQSHLRDCTVTAAAIGDISSERGYIRLERLSCIDQKGNVLDIPVKGTVFDPTGKAGIRGVAVHRESEQLIRAALAGTLSGISQAVSQNYAHPPFYPVANAAGGDSHIILNQGLAEGSGDALAQLAHYHIKRAEQYQPVIQVSAGTVVDIVFLEGFHLDFSEHSIKQAANKVNEKIHEVEQDDYFKEMGRDAI